jgi:hypothetical protein
MIWSWLRTRLQRIIERDVASLNRLAASFSALKLFSVPLSSVERVGTVCSRTSGGWQVLRVLTVCIDEERPPTSEISTRCFRHQLVAEAPALDQDRQDPKQGRLTRRSMSTMLPLSVLLARCFAEPQGKVTVVMSALIGNSASERSR